MKKLITITSLIAAGAICANAAVTIKPLLDNNTTTGTWTDSDEGTFNYTAGSWSATPNWQVFTAAYTLTNNISLTKDEVLDFSYNINRGSAGSGDSVLTVGFVGSTQAIVTGHGTYNKNNDAQIGQTENVSAPGFSFADSSNDKTIDVLTAGATLENATSPSSKITTLSGNISWSDADNQFKLILSSSETSGNASMLLGTSVDISKIVLTIDGYQAGNFSSAADYPTISNLNVSVAAAPEPSAFGLLAGLGALALVGTRRRRKTK